jgi:hypothetical protein
MALGDVIGRLSVVLGLDTAAFETGAKRAARTTQDAGDRFEAMGRRVGTAAKAIAGIGAAIVGSQIVGGIRNMAFAGLEHAAALGEQAQQLGVTTSELQRYRYIASQVGIDQEVMDKGLARLSITLGDLANGAKGPAEALARLGLGQQEIARVSQLTAGQAIPELAEAFAQLKSPTEAASIASDLFGAKLGGKFLTLLMGGRAEIDNLTAAYKRLGIEISEGQIAKADKAMDDLAAMQQVFAARQAQIAADNSEALLKGQTAWENFKVKTLVVFGELAEGITGLIDKNAEWERSEQDLWAKLGAGWDQFEKDHAAFQQRFHQNLVQLGEGIRTLAVSGLQWIAKLVEGIRTWIGDRLSAVWTGALAKIEQVRQAFFDLWDKVTRRSYVPDMVDDIAHEMARLDAVMVDPALSATARTKKAFEQLGADVRAVMTELFPDARNLADFQNKLATLDSGIARGGAGGFSAAQLSAARERLLVAADPAQRGSVALPLSDQLRLWGDRSLFNGEQLSAALDKLGGVANDNAEGIEAANVRIAKSFADMAQQTTAVITRLASAIKGGGFLDILGSVIDLGVQLAGLGLFGKSAKKSVNSIPGFANGTSFAPGGLALVGERGPELVNLPRGAQVHTNRELAGLGGNTYNFSGNLMTPEFWEMIQAGDMRAAQAGAQAGSRIVFSRQNRRVA